MSTPLTAAKAGDVVMRPCIVCGALTAKSRCPRHAYKRPSAAKRGYDATWQRIRRTILAAHPACILCGREATEVDHVIPLRPIGDTEAGSRLDARNLQPLCSACHVRKTRHENQRRAAEP